MISVDLAGTRNIVNSWSEADAVSDMFLTFDSLSLAKVIYYSPHQQSGVVTQIVWQLESLSLCKHIIRHGWA